MKTINSKPMKRTSLLFIIIIIVSISIESHAQAPTKENIYTLQPNESIVYGENCFSYSDQGKNVFIVIKGGDGFYTLTNGVRKGPFKEMSDNLVKPCNQSTNNCAAYDPSGDANDNIYNKYVVPSDDGEVNINFNGKTYGPFANLLFFQVSENKSKFIASVTDISLNKKLIISSGKTIPLEGMVSSVKFSPYGDFAIIKVGFDFMTPNLDPSKINSEQLNSFSVLTSEGTKFGPFNSDKITDSDIWFTKTTGNHWFIKNGEELLLDGKSFMKMPESSGRCDLWFSPDCKRYAISNYEKMKFSDNESIPYPIQTTLFYKDGKAYLRCVTIENEREINVYTKGL